MVVLHTGLLAGCLIEVWPPPTAPSCPRAGLADAEARDRPQGSWGGASGPWGTSGTRRSWSSSG